MIAIYTTHFFNKSGFGVGISGQNLCGGVYTPLHKFCPASWCRLAVTISLTTPYLIDASLASPLEAKVPVGIDLTLLQGVSL